MTDGVEAGREKHMMGAQNQNDNVTDTFTELY